MSETSYANTHLQAANDKYVPEYDAASCDRASVWYTAKLSLGVERLDPIRFAGFNLGDAHIIRNGGGRVVDAVRSVVVSQEMLATREVIVVHHTNCGFTKVDQSLLLDKIKKRAPASTHALAQSIAPLEIHDPFESVKDDVQFLRGFPLIYPETTITGWVFHSDTGKLEKVAQS
ncbi:hypothetical protein OIV83_003474 [Microbotryomycetes sp. JL201]|nr:hypothetical protein OIV83_003474 [Microbotryomycetes sp. JL201]